MTAFFVALCERRDRVSRTTAEDRQKTRADDQALHDAIVSPPHHKEQSLWRLQMYQEYTAGAIYLPYCCQTPLDHLHCREEVCGRLFCLALGLLVWWLPRGRECAIPPSSRA